MWDSFDCSYKWDITCWLLALITKFINAVSNFLEVFFTDWWTERQTDRQTDKHTDSLCPCCAYHKRWFPDPQLYWGSGNKTTVLLCVCTVFSVQKLFIVHLAIFTAGSKPTSKAELFPHISRWCVRAAWEQCNQLQHLEIWMTKKFLEGPPMI